VKLTRYGIVGIAASAALGVGSFALTAVGVPWLAIVFVGPGALLSMAVGGALQLALPLSTQERILAYIGDGPGPYIGLMIAAAFGIWALAIGLGYWWVSKAAAVPKCPACNGQFRWRDGLRLWNPWNYLCPFCGTPLEASKLQKTLVLCSVPLGIALAAIPIYFEEMGKWHTKDSWLFVLVIVALLTVSAIVSWPLIRFKVKSK